MNIFDSKCTVLVNPVNCVGVMGKGLAKQFKEKFPLYFDDYKAKCNLGLIHLGACDYYQHNYAIENGEFKYTILCSFPTKYHWMEFSKLENIISGLKDLRRYAATNNYSVAIPAIGAGLGGLRWSEVKVQIIDIMRNTTYELYEPQ